MGEPKKRFNSKAKGSSFEREIAKKLSLWCSYGQREDCLWRSSMSGGRATVSRKKGTELKSQCGDLSAINEYGQPFINAFYPELKNYRDLGYESILIGKGNLLKFWEITKTEANVYNKLPMLIARQNRLPAVVCLQRQGMIRLGLTDGNTILSSWRYGLFIVLLDEFLNWAKPV